MTIHPTAIIDPTAQIGQDVEIGPYVLVEREARIGDRTRVDAYTFIGPDTRIGPDNHIGHHAVVGSDSQDRKFRGEKSWVEIGAGNVLREFVTVNRATGEGQATRIGDNCLLMTMCHIAHNCVLGNSVIMANSTHLGGEIEIHDHAVIGGLVGIHQGCRIGTLAMVGACSKVTQDILPYTLADGHPARPYGVNRVGLQRHDFPPDTIAVIKDAFKRLFYQKDPLDRALAALCEIYPNQREVRNIAEFIRNSTREYGIARPLPPGEDDGSLRQEAEPVGIL